MNNFTQTFFTSSRNSFNKFVAICSFLLVCNLSYGQAPFIQTGAADGLGQYGYLEKDATTFARLNSNTYGNIFQLFARTFVNGNNVLTYGTAVNSCGGSGIVQSTNNYNFGANAIAGQIAYTSVHADYCGGANSYGGNPNQVGFNERQHYLFDISDRPSDLSSSIVQMNAGASNVVMSVRIDFGSVSSRVLQRFWIQNGGTLAEASEIANDGFKIYYEAATGSETFNGNESVATLFGDFGGNATNNNQYGHDALNIAIPSGGLRIYVVLNRFNSCITTAKTAQVSLLNDGLNFTPNMDTSFSLSRVNQTPASPTAISVATAPVTGALNGTYYIPSSCFPTVASAVTYLNTNGVAGPVIFNVAAGHTETAPTGGYSITATGTISNTIKFQKFGTGVNPTFTAPTWAAGGNADGVFEIVGGDYITIDGFTIQENASNIVTATGATNTMTEFGIGMFLSLATNGAQNNTIQNCTITLNSAYGNGIGIFSSSNCSSTNAALAATATTGTNSNNKIYSNTISNVAFGVYFLSPPNTASIVESGNDIGGSSSATANTITFGSTSPSSGPWLNSPTSVSAGIEMRNSNGSSIRFNNVTSNALSYSMSAFGGIQVNGTAPTGGTYTTTISNNTITLTNNGTTSITGIDFGYGTATGTIVGSNNTIVLNQNAAAANSAAIIGVRASYTSASNTQNANNITINQNTSAGALTSPVTGITVAGVGTTVNVGSAGNGNTISIRQNAPTGTGSYGSGAISFVDVSAASGTINVVSNTFNTTGSTIRSTGTLNVIAIGGITISTGLNITNNIANIDRVATTGIVNFFNQSSTSPNTPSNIITGNSITFTNIATSDAVTAIQELGGSTTGVKNINNNTISIAGTYIGTSTGIALGYPSSTNSPNIQGNSITMSSASPTSIGILTNGNANAVVISGNTLNITSSTTSPTSMIGISCASSGANSITNNTFTNLNFTGIFSTGGTTSGIAISNGTSSNIFNNTITNIAVGGATSSGSPTINGILVSGGPSVNVYQNKIFGLSTLATGAATNVNGIRLSGGTTNTVYNNTIGGLTATASASTDAIRGISITSTQTTSTQNIFHNTVYLNASSSGANFGTTGIFHNAFATATTSALNLRNNIIINNSTPAGTGRTVAYRRSSNALNNYSATSNNNLFYAGAPGANNVIFSDGTNNDQTLADFKTRMATRDQASQTENTTFQSTTGSNANFLRIAIGTTSYAESGAVLITTPLTINTDYWGITRPFPSPTNGGSTPDMGASEFDGIPALVNCIAPADQATSLVPGAITSNTATASFTAAASAPSGYLVVASNGTPFVGTPVDGTTYTAGNALGNGAVIQMSSSTTASNFALPSNTAGNLAIFSYNTGSCVGGPKYNTVSPLTGVVTTCAAAPTVPVNGTVTSTGFTGSWTASSVGGSAGAITYTMEIHSNATYTALVGSAVTGITGVSNTVSGLTPYTQYWWRIKATNGSCDSAYLNGTTFTTLQVPTNIPYTQNFTSANDFVFINGSQTNKWSYGSATGNTGASLYVSTDSGVTNTYNTGVASVVQAYRDIIVPSGTTTSSFSFDWKANGESCCDYFRVWLAPASFTPTAGTQISAGAGLIQIGTNFNVQTSWQTYSNAALDLSSYANTTMRLIFEWRNDASLGTSPPVAIDNVSLTVPTCLVPVLTATTAITSTTATINWTAPASAPSNGYNYEVRTSGAAGSGATGLTTSGAVGAGIVTANITGLTAATSYSVYVQSNCGGSGTSAWSTAGTFTTACDVPNNPGTISVTSPSATGFTLNYAAASPAPTNYILFNSTGTVATAIPTLVNGTTYANATAYTFGGNSYNCITNTSASPQGLSGGISNTQYNYFLYSKSTTNSCFGSPYYSTGVSVSAITCPAAPTLPVASLITSSSATVSWTASIVGGGAATINYTLEVYTDAGYTTPISGSPFTMGTTVSQALSGLSDSTTYYYRVKANNGSCDSTYLAGSFVTTCGALNVPYSQNFDSVTQPTLPNCMTALDSNADTFTWVTCTSTSLGNLTAITPNSGANQAGIRYNSSAAMNDWLILPGINMTGSTSYRLSFYARGYTGLTETFEVKYGTSATAAAMTTAIAASTTITGGTAYTLYTYDFTPSATGVNYIGIHGISASNQWYIFVDDIKVDLSPLPITITPSPSATICNGDSTTLTASSSAAYTYTWSPATGLSATTGATVSANPTTTTIYTVTGVAGSMTNTQTITVTVNPAPAAVTITPSATTCPNVVTTLTASSASIGTYTVGTSSGSSAAANTPYRQAVGAANQSRVQYLISKAELNAAGINSAANLTSLGFNVTTAGSGTMSNYTISMTNTNLTVLTSTYQTPTFTTVFSGTNILPVSGINTHTFSSPFAWDGTSNVLVNICHQGAGGTASTVSIVTPTNVSTTSGGGNNQCNLTTGGASNANRPVMIFGVAGQITWAPTTDLYTDSGATTSYTGGAAGTVYAKPASTVTYTATASLGSCTKTNTTTITTKIPVGIISVTAAANPICPTATTTLTANGVVGDNALVTWYTGTGATGTNLGTGATLVAGPGTYYAFVTGDCGTAEASVVVNANTLPTASISGNNGPAVCSGSDITFSLTGTSGAVVTYNLNGGSNTTATLTGGSATVTVTAATATQTLNLVSVTDGTCPATLSGSSTVVIESTTWNGTSWTNGTPTSTKAVIFTGNYTIGANFDACSISVSNNAVVSVTSGFNVNLSNTITVASGSSFTLNNNANLLQSNPAAVNTGNIIVKRQSNPLIRLDYTLWSSPVTGQGLYSFSPFTFANRFYVYDTTSNLYNNSSIGFNVTGTNAAGVNGTDNANVLFTTGKGYLIRLPYNHPTAPIIFNGSFTGVPNNGTKTITLANVSATQQFNAVGNPYPSPINIAQFATDNTNAIEPTLYFWRKTNNTASPSYCTWNTTSSLYGDNGEAYTNSPNGVIQTGQGFLVEAKDGATSLEFNNGQRVANNANQFFRTNTVATPTTQPDAIWLNLTGTGAEFSQTVVSYFTNATLGADAYDSKYFNDGAVALNMLIGSTEYVIQGRPTFQATDIVPLNYKVTTAGNYTFAIDHVDGLFAGGAQAIYIKDNQDGSYHNLSTPYTFTSTAGTFANRFELVYQTALAVDNNDFTANSINVIKQQNDVVVRTSGTTMKEVTIYDIRGRVLVTKTNINASETKINVGTTNQVLLVQVTTVDGVKATKKVVN